MLKRRLPLPSICPVTSKSPGVRPVNPVWLIPLQAIVKPANVYVNGVGTPLSSALIEMLTPRVSGSGGQPLPPGVGQEPIAGVVTPGPVGAAVLPPHAGNVARNRQ